MDLNILKGKKHIHFIGIGGSGMYPLVQILHSQGYNISGSDNNETDTLQAVRDMGIKVYFGQRAENIEGADLIVHTAAIMADNPELIAAKNSGVTVLERSELLGIVTSWYERAVCVSGTHGKTTTTSMITQILYTQGMDISAFIGGKLPCINGSGLAGKSDIMVCESCEFVDTFLKLYPDIAVILNVDADHLDYFGTLDNVITSFGKFAAKASKALIINGDDENTAEAVRRAGNLEGKDVVTFGYRDCFDYYPVNIEKINGIQTKFTVMHKGQFLADITLSVPGEHNIINALAAVAAAHYVGADVKSIQQGLSDFRGAKRRFEIIGKEKGITVADDYAHHPAELTVTLNAAMEMGFKRVWAVFQPFTYSRTSMLLDDFAKALSIADRVVLTDIMGSREKNTFNIFTKDLADKIENCTYFPYTAADESDPERKMFNFGQVCDYLAENVQEGDLVITLGCGDAYKIAKMLCGRLS